MTDQDHADIIFRLSALERMVSWMAAQDIRRAADQRAALHEMSASLHSLLDEHMTEDFPGAQAMKEEVSARLDHLLQAVVNEVQRS